MGLEQYAPMVLLAGIFYVIYLLQIRPAQKLAKENSTSVMSEISSSFWTGWGILFGCGGAYLLYASSDPETISQIVRQSGPSDAGSTLSLMVKAGYGLLGLGIALFVLGLAKSIFVPKSKED